MDRSMRTTHRIDRSVSDLVSDEGAEGDEGDDRSIRYVAASIIAGIFFSEIGAGVAFPTLPALGSILGITPFLVGAILAINRFTWLLMSPPAGQAIDRFGPRRPMIAGFVLQGLAPFGYAFGVVSASYGIAPAAVFLVARAAWGVGAAFVFVGGFSTLTHVTTTEDRGEWIGYMRGAQSLGFPAGLVVGGVVTDAAGYSAAFVVAGIAGLFAAVVGFFVLPNTVSAVRRAGRLRDLPSIVSKDRRVLTVGVVNFIVQLVFLGVFLSTVVLYTREHGIRIGTFSETGASGIIMAVSAVFSAATTVLVGRYSDRLSNRSLVTLPMLGLFAAGFVVLALFPTLLGAFVGVALVGIGVGGTNPPLLAYLGDISPSGDVGKLGGVYNSFGALGGAIGPLIALPIAAAFGFRIEYLACTALAVLSAGLVALTLSGSAEPMDRPTVVGED